MLNARIKIAVIIPATSNIVLVVDVALFLSRFAIFFAVVQFPFASTGLLACPHSEITTICNCHIKKLHQQSIAADTLRHSIK